MRAATKFAGEIAETQYPNLLTVFFAKQSHCPTCDRIVVTGQLHLGFNIFQNFTIHQLFYLLQLLRRQRLEVCKIKTQTIITLNAPGIAQMSELSTSFRPG